MGQVLIRNIDDDVIERIRLRARVKGASLEQELRDIIRDAAALSSGDRNGLIDAFHRKHGMIAVAETPEDIIRDAREAR
jgi:antitoxin FitA